MTLHARTLAALAAFACAGSALAEPQRFAAPEAAVEALIAALRAEDVPAALAVIGPENEDVLLTGEDAADREAWGDFLEAYDALSRIDAREGVATLYVGENQWPAPIPIARGEDGLWAFDAEGARDEIFFRRIGRNELETIATLRAYVEVQRAFRAVDHDGDGVMEFAERIASSPGSRDGLYWPTGPDGVKSPAGDLAGGADALNPAPEPLHGYLYRVLTAQGPSAPGGLMNYRVNGHLVAGHALIAYPYEWGETGVMSFLVGENGAIWESDLGEDTAARAAAIVAFDPGAGWSLAE